MNKRNLRIIFYSTLFGAALIVLLTIIVLLNTDNTQPGSDTSANASTSINSLATVNAIDCTSASDNALATASTSDESTTSDSTRSASTTSDATTDKTDCTLVQKQNTAIKEEKKPTLDQTKNTNKETTMSEAEFEDIRATVNDFIDIIAKTSKSKINPILLSLSGLEPSYNGMMIAQEMLRNQITEFNAIADKTKAFDIKSSNADKMLATTSNLESLKTNLSTKLSELKPAMKAKDIDKVEVLLVEITDTLNNTIEQIEKLNSAMVE